MSADMFLDLPTTPCRGRVAKSAEWVYPHKSSALQGYVPPPLQRRTAGLRGSRGRVYGACAAEAAASEALGLSVSGCIRARRYFGPHPVIIL